MCLLEAKLILCLCGTVRGKTMINRLSGSKVVGVKQTVKCIKSGKAKTVYVAADADH